MWSMPGDSTAWKNDNNSQNQCVSMRINENHYKYIDFQLFVSFGPWTLKEVGPYFWSLVGKVRPSMVRSLKLSNREPGQY